MSSKTTRIKADFVLLYLFLTLPTRMNILDQDLLFCDLETTGGNQKIDKIIEIGFIHVRNGTVIDRYQQLVNPQQKINPFITRITGITDKMLVNQPCLKDILSEVLAWIKNKTFIAHNVQFDYGVLKNELERLGHTFETKKICTVKLSRKLYPEHKKHNLDALIKRFKLTGHARHRALGDTEALWQVWQNFLIDHPDTIVSQIQQQIYPEKIEPKFCLKILKDLSQQPGFYVLENEEKPIYVSYAENLQQKINTHFDHEIKNKTDKRLIKETTQIKTYPSVGLVAAKLAVIDLQKKIRPKYNRRLNANDEHWSFELIPNKNGYLEPKFFGFIPEKTQIKIGSYGLFATKISAERRLKQIKTQAELFSENIFLSDTYNLRLQLALSNLKHQPWPLKNPLRIQETCQQTNTKKIHLFHNWCYLGSATTEDEANQITQQTTPVFCPHYYSLIKSLV